MNGSGCRKCPVMNCDTSNYRGSRCRALRSEFGLGDPKTVMDYIQTATEEQLARFIRNEQINALCDKRIEDVPTIIHRLMKEIGGRG